MRELHAYHGEHRRHAHDAGAATETPGRHARDHAHDATKHEARDSLKLKMLLDPEARKAERLRYEKAVDEVYRAKHAAGELRPQEAKPEHRPPETRDRPAGRRVLRRSLGLPRPGLEGLGGLAAVSTSVASWVKSLRTRPRLSLA